jgi:hypothetical protein
MAIRRRRRNPGTFKIIYQGEEYGGMPSNKPTPKGWTVLRDGFSSKKEAQQFLWDEIDKIPEGFGLPTAQSLKDDAVARKMMRGNPSRRPYAVERRAHRRADREDPHNRGHGLRWFELLPFKNNEILKRRAASRRKHENPLPKSAPSRALLCVGQLRELEIYDPRTDSSQHIKPKNKWLAWDGKQFHVCNVSGQANATLPPEIIKKHKKFHQANPRGKPFVGSMPTRNNSVRDVGLLKSVVYYVPTKIKSPGKNKYLWHHSFGDTGHKGRDNYPIKVMPMLQKDSAGNFFIKRRPGNIFKVDQWLRG